MITGEEISGEMQVPAILQAIVLRARALPGAVGAVRRILTLSVVFAVSAGTLLSLSAPAGAATAIGHEFLAQLTEAPPGTPLGEPLEAVAVDSEGTVFVVTHNENEEPVVDVFNSSHAYLTQFGSGTLQGEGLRLAVDLDGRVYVTDPETSTVDVFKPNEKSDKSKGYQLLSKWTGAETTAKEFTEPAGVAIDNSTSNPAKENVYVISRGEPAVVDVFKPKPEGPEEAKEGKFEGTFKHKLETPSAVAVNSTTGQVYVADSAKLVVYVFNDDGELETTKITGKGSPTKSFGESIPALAVEETTSDVYVVDAENGAVDQFNAAAEWIGWLTTAEPGGTPAPLESLAGVAVDNSTSAGDVYISAGLINIFGRNEPVPRVVTGKATKIERTSAQLNGKLDTGVPGDEYHFEYFVDGALLRTPSAPAPEAESSVSEVVKGLKAGEASEFRLVVERAHRPFYGIFAQFETAAAVTGVSTGPAESVMPTSATLTGSLEPDGFATKYHFEYGSTAALGSNIPVPFSQSSAKGVVDAVASLAGLKPDTTYHYRLVASNEFGTTYATELTFSTAGPGVTTEPAEPVGQTTATLNAKINPNKLATKYHFEYGDANASENKTPEGELAAGESTVAVSVPLTALKLATTYHFRIVAENSAGSFVGPEQEFTTVLIESASAKEVTGESAALQAQINPLGVKASYRFEYGETTVSEHETPEADVVAPEGTFRGEWSGVTEYKEGDIVEEGGRYFISLKAANTGKTPRILPEWWAVYGDVRAEQSVGGLRPETTYHYRVAVIVAGVTADGPEELFTTPASSVGFKLPDGRVYEMVTPPNKQGGYVQTISHQGGLIEAAEDGDALTYVVDGPVGANPEGNKSPEQEQILATRGSTEWSSQDIVTPTERLSEIRGKGAEYDAFSPDLSLALLQPTPGAYTPLAEPPLTPPMSEAERGHQEKAIYLREDAPLAPATAEGAIYEEAKADGEVLAREHGEAEAKPGYVALVNGENVLADAKFGGCEIPFPREGAPECLEAGEQPIRGDVLPDLEVDGASPDLSHVVLRSIREPLLEGALPGGLYEWAGGTLRLVSVLPDGKPANAPDAELGSGELPAEPTNGRNAISANGTRVVWTDNDASGALGHLYMRDTEKEQTVELDVPENGPPAEKGSAVFQSASADGSRVFFTDTESLTQEALASTSGNNLYMCEMIEVGGRLTCQLSDLTPDHNAGEPAAVQTTVLGTSEKGSYIYVVAKGALAAGADAGANNLYILHDEGGWTTKFIASLSNEDFPDWTSSHGNYPNLVDLTARVSPDGQYLAFMSNQPLTGYDNIDVNDEHGRHKDEEVFLYSAQTGSIVCASCDPSGARPQGVYDTKGSGEGEGLRVDGPGIWRQEDPGLATADPWLAGNIPGWTPIDTTASLYQSRYLSDSGRLFFNSADALVPEAAGKTRKETVEGRENEPVGVENVYEYEPDGVGSCTKPSGCVALISNGKSDKESAFLDASADGNDVFFLTAEKLLPQDTDSAYDIYDARVCEASSHCPLEVVQGPAAPCGSTEACRPGNSGAPGFEAPPSSTFSGPGNVVQVAPSGAALPAKVTKPPAPLTRAQKLALALKQCRKLPRKTRAEKKKRATCEAQAKKKYGPTKAKKAKRTTKHPARSKK